MTAEHLIVIGRGRLIADATVDDFIRRHSKNVVRVRSPHADQLRTDVTGPDVTVASLGDGLIEIRGLTAEQIGQHASDRGYTLFELTPQQVTLEEAFIDITQGELEFQSHAGSEDTDNKKEVAA